jgi:hypothetical protein
MDSNDSPNIAGMLNIKALDRRTVYPELPRIGRQNNKVMHCTDFTELHLCKAPR